MGDRARKPAVLFEIGRLHDQRGETEQAIEYLQKSIASYEALGNKEGISNSSNSLGNVHSARGDYSSAMSQLQKALAIQEELGNKQRIAMTMNNIGIVHRLQNNLDLALEYQQRALALRESAGDKRGLVSSLNNIGLIYTNKGDYARALENYQKGLSLSQELGVKAEIANVSSNIGYTYRLQGDYARALEQYQKVLRLREEMGEKIGTARILHNLGVVYNLQGDYAKAVEHLERAADLAREGGYRDILCDSLTIAGNAYLALGQPARARQAFEQAIATAEERRAQVVGGEQTRQRFFEGMVSPYYRMVAILAGEGKIAEALAYAERAKARALLDVLRGGRANVTRAMSDREKEQEQRLRETLVSLNTQIAGESRRPQPDQNRVGQLNAQLEKTRLEYEDFQTRLYAAHPDLRTRRGDAPPLTPEQAGNLTGDQRTALLEYVVTDETTFLFALTGGGSNVGRNRLQEPVLRFYDLKIKRKELAERVKRLRERISNNDLEYADLSSQLYDLLIAPAISQLRGKTRLVIVPDDILWETPFQALRSPDRRFLIQSAAVSYAPSLTVLREIIKSGRARSSTTMLAMGNPHLAGQSISRSKSVLMSAGLEPLPEAERMVRGLEEIYGAKSSKVYVGAEAREEVLKAEAGAYGVLQLATHGVISDSSPMYSHVLLSKGDGGAEDGLLEAWEIMQMDLKADLAVLSACETARGRIGAGEGVIGLSWALFVAGCPTTVVSQWKVESASTTELMLGFHRGLKKGATKSEAMRQAAMKLMANKKYDHPFYWAAFIVVGDGR
jgi:CHAT domain-containing protein/Flp pilus assembly protein TadD